MHVYVHVWVCVGLRVSKHWYCRHWCSRLSLHKSLGRAKTFEFFVVQFIIGWISLPFTLNVCTSVPLPLLPHISSPAFESKRDFYGKVKRSATKGLTVTKRRRRPLSVLTPSFFPTGTSRLGDDWLCVHLCLSAVLAAQRDWRGSAGCLRLCRHPERPAHATGRPQAVCLKRRRERGG